MSKPVKELITREYRRAYADIGSACVVDLTGLNVQQTEALRSKLRGRSARLQVVKNSLARRAFAGSALEPLGAALEGPSALVTTADSIIDTAKLLVESAREFAKLRLKQAVVDGDRTVFTVAQVAQMRSRTELIGEVAMLVCSPGRALAGCLRSPQSKIAGCLKAMIEAKEGKEAA
jgi:large subunit ribosomal protein L10